MSISLTTKGLIAELFAAIADNEHLVRIFYIIIFYRLK